ncbi:MAG: 50S ribosomal protein L11 methyltransferase [Myxococcales bacterium]|nr:50S ribosomal protein L11 methyltransferase [Myxococcales bacterium]
MDVEDAQRAEVVAADLWELGALGVEERDDSTLSRGAQGAVTLVASFTDDAAARRAVEQLRATAPDCGAHVEHVVGDAWRDAWRAYFRATPIGARLLLRPSWEPVPASAVGRVVLTIDPGNAFGSGIHETTRLVLEALDRRVRGGERVLDVGCGSGILAVAACLLGAAEAVAIDIEPDAVAVTRDNATRNGVAERVDASTTPIDRVAGRFPLVVANIQAAPLIAMAGSLLARVDAGGVLVLSGVLAEHQDAVIAAFARADVEEVRADGEWVAIVLSQGAR